jgi:MFS family permease
MTSDIAAGPAAPRRTPAGGRPLWRNVPFQLLWIGQSAATLGVSVADVAYPLAILALTGSAARAGLFAAVQATGALAAGLPGGQLADRFDCRRIVIIEEGARAAVTAAVVAALLTGGLSLPLLLAAAALLGIGQSAGSAARYLLLRSAVPPAQLTSALAQDEIRMNGATLAGPPLAGALYAIRALAHSVPFLFTAGSFVVSLLTALLVRIRPSDDAAPAGPAATTTGAAGPGTAATGAAEAGDGVAGAAEPEQVPGMLAGIPAIWSQPVLRMATLLIMIVNTVGAPLDLVVVVILRHQGISPALIGLALSGGAAGGLAGATLVKVLHRLRPGILLLAICLSLIPVFALLAVPAGPWWAAGVLFASMLGVPSIRVLLDVLVFRQAPPEQRGRVLATVLTLIGVGAPAGLAAAGLLLQYLPAQAALLVLAGFLAVGVLACAIRRELWQARWPG